MGRAAWLAVAVLGLTACQPGAAARAALDPGGPVVDLPLPGGAVERLWYRQPERPAAVVILFAGSDGVLRIDDDGRFAQLGGNFLVRMREAWLARGLAVAIADAPSGGLRRGAGHPDVVRAVIAHVHTRTDAPIWLVGTSRGSVRAAFAAAAVRNEIAGLVLSSSVTRSNPRVAGETVFSADLDRVAVPTLVVAHRGDRCVLTPPTGAEEIRRALTGAPRREVVLVEGGSPPRSDACEAFSEHGYLGIETEVVDRIAAWITAP
jgi:hypothetical protein